MSALHPSRWPLAVWLILSLAGALLRITYTVGSFSLAPAVALLCGTWCGARRAAIVQSGAVVLSFAAARINPELGGIADLGLTLGLVPCAVLAGIFCTPDDRGARPPRWVRYTVFGAAGAVAGLALIVLPRQSAGVMFAITFLLGTSIALFYAYRMVPEPQRFTGYVFALFPYFALGIGWSFAVAWLMPARAVLAAIPGTWDAILVHAFFTQLPSQLIAVVLISYLVCALDRGGTDRGPMAIGASR